MRQPRRLSLFILVLVTLLTATGGIVSEIAVEQLPTWLEPFRPWVWPMLFVLILATVGLVLAQAWLDEHREDTSSSPPPPIHVHVEVPAPQPSDNLHIDQRPTVLHNLPNPDYDTFIGSYTTLLY